MSCSTMELKYNLCFNPIFTCKRRSMLKGQYGFWIIPGVSPTREESNIAPYIFRLRQICLFIRWNATNAPWLHPSLLRGILQLHFRSQLEHCVTAVNELNRPQFSTFTGLCWTHGLQALTNFGNANLHHSRLVVYIETQNHTTRMKCCVLKRQPQSR